MPTLIHVHCLNNVQLAASLLIILCLIWHSRGIEIYDYSIGDEMSHMNMLSKKMMHATEAADNSARQKYFAKIYYEFPDLGSALTNFTYILQSRVHPNSVADIIGNFNCARAYTISSHIELIIPPMYNISFVFKNCRTKQTNSLDFPIIKLNRQPITLSDQADNTIDPEHPIQKALLGNNVSKYDKYGKSRVRDVLVKNNSRNTIDSNYHWEPTIRRDYSMISYLSSVMITFDGAFVSGINHPFIVEENNNLYHDGYPLYISLHILNSTFIAGSNSQSNESFINISAKYAGSKLEIVDSRFESFCNGVIDLSWASSCTVSNNTFVNCGNTLNPCISIHIYEILKDSETEPSIQYNYFLDDYNYYNCFIDGENRTLIYLQNYDELPFVDQQKIIGNHYFSDRQTVNVLGIHAIGSNEKFLHTSENLKEVYPRPLRYPDGNNVVERLSTQNDLSSQFTDIISGVQFIREARATEYLQEEEEEEEEDCYCIVLDKCANYENAPDSIIEDHPTVCDYSCFVELQEAINNCVYSTILLDREQPIYVSEGLDIFRETLTISTLSRNKHSGIIIADSPHIILQNSTYGSIVLEGLIFASSSDQFSGDSQISYHGNGDKFSIINCMFISPSRGAVFFQNTVRISSSVGEGGLNQLCFDDNYIVSKSGDAAIVVDRINYASIVRNFFTTFVDNVLLSVCGETLKSLEIYGNYISQESQHRILHRLFPIFEIVSLQPTANIRIAKNSYNYVTDSNHISAGMISVQDLDDTNNVIWIDNNPGMLISGLTENYLITNDGNNLPISNSCIVNSRSVIGGQNRFSDLNQALKFCENKVIFIYDKICTLDWSSVRKNSVTIELIGISYDNSVPIVLCISPIILYQRLEVFRMANIDLRTSTVDQLSDRVKKYPMIHTDYQKNDTPFLREINLTNCTFSATTGQRQTLLGLNRLGHSLQTIRIENCKFRHADNAIEITFTESQIFAKIEIIDNDFLFINCSALSLPQTPSFVIRNNVFHNSGGLSSGCSSLVYCSPRDGHDNLDSSFIFENNLSSQTLNITHPTSGNILRPHWITTYWLDGFSLDIPPHLSLVNNSCKGHPIGIRLSNLRQLAKSPSYRQGLISDGQQEIPSLFPISDFVENTLHCKVFGYLHDVVLNDVIDDGSFSLNSSNNTCSSNVPRGYVNHAGVPIFFENMPSHLDLVPHIMPSQNCKCPILPPPFCIVDYGLFGSSIHKSDPIFGFIGTWIFHKISEAIFSCQDPSKFIVVRNSANYPVVKENIIVSRSGFTLMGENSMEFSIMGSHVLGIASINLENLILQQENNSPVWNTLEIPKDSNSLKLPQITLKNCTIIGSPLGGNSSIVGSFGDISISNSTFKSFNPRYYGQAIINVQSHGTVIIDYCHFFDLHFTAINILECESYQIIGNTITLSNFVVPLYVQPMNVSSDHFSIVHCESHSIAPSSFFENSLSSDGLMASTGFWLESNPRILDDVQQNYTDILPTTKLEKNQQFVVPILHSNSITSGSAHVGLRITHKDRDDNYVLHSTDYLNEIRNLIVSKDNLDTRGNWHDVVLVPPLYDNELLRFPHNNYEHICDAGCQTSDYIGLSIVVVFTITLCYLMCMCICCGSRGTLNRPIHVVFSQYLGRLIPSSKKYWPTIMYGYFDPWGHQARPIPAYDVEPSLAAVALANQNKVSKIVTSSIINKDNP